jgi:hypothetical protein
LRKAWSGLLSSESDRREISLSDGLVVAGWLTEVPGGAAMARRTEERWSRRLATS